MVDVLVKKMDERTYKLVKMLAVKEDKTVAAVLREAVQNLVAIKKKSRKARLSDIPPFSLGPESRHLSTQIDDILYGDST